jgi:predicted hotdog family 3-hydroxylacyl-ACP dehydratase
MSLLDEIVESEGDRLVARLTVRDDGLFNDPALQGAVPAWVGVEYLAQAAAAHLGVEQRRNGQPPRVGFLLGTRLYTSNVAAFVPGTVLTVSVERSVLAQSGMAAYDGRLEGEGIVATASINTFLPKDASSLQSMLAQVSR